MMLSDPASLAAQGVLPYLPMTMHDGKLWWQTLQSFSGLRLGQELSLDDLLD